MVHVCLERSLFWSAGEPVGCEEPAHEHEHVSWPDYGVPDDPEALDTTLLALLTRARSGEVVEVGCLGGHSRTGTVLAYLAVLTVVAPVDAVAWVRERYCPLAAETDEQMAFVAALPPA